MDARSVRVEATANPCKAPGKLMIREAFATGALVVALIAGYEAKSAHDRLNEERVRTDRLVRILHKRIFQIENWHGWPPAPWSTSEAVREHEHRRESE